MKQTLVKGVLAALVGVGLMVGSAFATPIFTGDPLADFGIGDSGLPTNPLGPGYYIWANDEERTSWSVRWTGKEWDVAGQPYASYQWGGSITFSNNDGLSNPIEVLWDSGDGSIPSLANGIGSDVITFGVANAGPHWDGFDFTLTGVAGDYLTFSLDSTYFTTENDGVYLGQGLVSVLDNSLDTQYFRSGNGLNRQFEIAAPVPEPATMLLFGAGLAGLAGISRRRKK